MSAAGAMITSAIPASARSDRPLSWKAALGAGLVHRAGHDVRGAEGERRRDRRGRSEPAAGPDAHGAPVAALGDDAVAEAEDRREERRQRPVVGVAAGVGLRGEILRQRERRGEPRLLRRQLAPLHEPAQDLRRRRLEEADRHLLARDLREEVVLPPRLPGGVRRQARGGIADDGRRQRHVGRGLDARHAAAEVEVGHGLLELGLVRAVDEVCAPGKAFLSELVLQLVKRRFDPRRREPRRAEEAEAPGAGHLGDEPHRGDPVRHRPRDVGEARAVRLAERPVPEPLRVEGRQRGHVRERPGPAVRCGRNQLTPEAEADPASVVADDVRGGSDLFERAPDLGRREGGRAPVRPPAERRSGRAHEAVSVRKWH
jgi:hypothetical protein